MQAHHDLDNYCIEDWAISRIDHEVFFFNSLLDQCVNSSSRQCIQYLESRWSGFRYLLSTQCRGEVVLAVCSPEFEANMDD